jgi:hypothetical protein
LSIFRIWNPFVKRRIWLNLAIMKSRRQDFGGGATRSMWKV